MKKPANSPKTLISYGKQFYDRRWMWGTSGNISVRLKDKPLSIAITASGMNKGHLQTKDLLAITDGKPVRAAKGLIPSSETLIHQALYRAMPDVSAVFHVHPMYATLISKFYGHPTEPRYLKVEWMEVLKGVNVNEDEIAEFVILPNWQDVSLIARDITEYLKSAAKPLPAVLIYNHGLTGWGATPDQARNYLEIMEYVCQYLYLKTAANQDFGRPEHRLS